MRIVSEVLESSGSTSMASTCASSLALLLQLPVKSSVAGIAMGLIKEDSKDTVLSDIHELEDFLGDMDFKVAGNDSGITALQMDIKIKGIPLDLLRQAIRQAKAGRLHILEAMNSVISEPRTELRKNSPRIDLVKIDSDKIGLLLVLVVTISNGLLKKLTVRSIFLMMVMLQSIHQMVTKLNLPKSMF